MSDLVERFKRRFHIECVICRLEELISDKELDEPRRRMARKILREYKKKREELNEQA